MSLTLTEELRARASFGAHFTLLQESSRMGMFSGLGVPPPGHLAVSNAQSNNQAVLIPYSYNPHPIQQAFVGWQKTSKPLLHNADPGKSFMGRNVWTAPWASIHQTQSVKKGILPKKIQNHAACRSKQPGMFRAKKQKKNTKNSHEPTSTNKYNCPQGQLQLPTYNSLGSFPRTQAAYSSAECSLNLQTSVSTLTRDKDDSNGGLTMHGAPGQAMPGIPMENLVSSPRHLHVPQLQKGSVEQSVSCSNLCVMVDSPDSHLHYAGMSPKFPCLMYPGQHLPYTNSCETTTTSTNVLQGANSIDVDRSEVPPSFSVFGMNPITSVCQSWAQDVREGRIR